MLRKLMKYEIKATARIIIPMQLALLIFSIINRLINPFSSLEKANSFNLQVFINAMSIFIYFALIVGVIAITLVIVIQRFYKNLLGDEGYLMFTLPVKVNQHLLSKLITAVFWMIVSGLSLIFSVLIISCRSGLSTELAELYKALKNMFGTTGLIGIGLYILIALTHGILVIYSSISLGHQVNNHKIIASFAAFCILYLITQIILAILLLLLAWSYGFLEIGAADLQFEPAMLYKLLLPVSIVLILLGIGHFLLNNYVLKHRLNLE